MICKSKGLTPNSISAMKTDLNLFLRFLGGKHIKDVSHIDCDDFMMMCMNERNNGDWALSRKHVSINMFYETLIKKEYLEITNPMNKVEKIKVRRKNKEYLTSDEIAQVFVYLREVGDLRGLALFSLLYSSACRISEIYQLNISSMNFDTREFSVIGKGLKFRDCFFSEQAGEDIVNYLKSREDSFEPLFMSRQSNRWSKRAIQKYVQDTVYRVGIKKRITPHSLRHSILTNLRLSGALLEDLQLLAGHSSISTTQSVYTHVGLSDVRSKFDSFHDKL